AWGEAKERLFERIDVEITPLRARYDALMADPAAIERTLRAGAARLREQHAAPFVARLRHAVGLRDLSALETSTERGAVAAEALPVFKQYREADGRFHFKLVDG